MYYLLHTLLKYIIFWLFTKWYTQKQNNRHWKIFATGSNTCQETAIPLSDNKVTLDFSWSAMKINNWNDDFARVSPKENTSCFFAVTGWTRRYFTHTTLKRTGSVSLIHHLGRFRWSQMSRMCLMSPMDSRRISFVCASSVRNLSKSTGVSSRRLIRL